MTLLSADEVQQLVYQVWGASFVLSLLVGVLIHRGHFCTLGAISDWVLMRDATRLRQWALAVAVAIAGFGVMAWLGWISPLNTIYASAQLPWLSALFGGGLFGIGMVLASGCSSKSLVRMAAGNLKSLVVLLVMAFSALAAMRGLTAVWRVHGLDKVAIDLPHGPFVGQWLSSVTGWDLRAGLGISAALVSLLMVSWILKDRRFHTVFNWVTGAGLGLLVVLPSSPVCPAGVFPARRFFGGGSGSWGSAAFALGSGRRVLLWLPGSSAPPAWAGVDWAGWGPGWWLGLPLPPPAQLSLF